MESQNTPIDEVPEAVETQSVDNNAQAAKEKLEKEVQTLRGELFLKEAHIRDLQKKVSEYESKTGEIREYVKKMESEIEQVRLRAKRDLQKSIDQKVGELASGLIKVIDNFELSLKNAQEATPFVDGVKLIYQDLIQKLRQWNIESISAKGQAFDPNLHEAMVTQPVEAADQDGVVLEEIVTGYKLKEQLLRPARVVVGKYEENQIN